MINLSQKFSELVYNSVSFFFVCCLIATRERAILALVIVFAMLDPGEVSMLQL